MDFLDRVHGVGWAVPGDRTGSASVLAAVLLLLLGLLIGSPEEPGGIREGVGKACSQRPEVHVQAETTTPEVGPGMFTWASQGQTLSAQ